ncbi:MAG: class I SAM-dependent methyltransferase [Desulfovibrio sp.]|jgi:SAM-dependent methyltransferase|nr:class I SAM-dependent methyltransferase [Desulfovibrio sp.]
MEPVYMNPAFLEKVSQCPLCGEQRSTPAYAVSEQAGVRLCPCGVHYCDHRLTPEGLAAYWKDYQVNEHSADAEECALRQRMYQVDFEYIARFLKKRAQILDVGCADGLFLDVFAARGHLCHGVEFGHSAAQAAAQKHRVWEGHFPDMDIPPGYDLIIFRGVLQYLHKPRHFFQKAVSLLRPDGLVFITAQPNMDSFCHKLYQNRFRLGLTPCDCVGFSPKPLVNEFGRLGCRLAGEAFFYEETPYARPAEDIAAVHAALESKRAGGEIASLSPPFWGNMMTLVFQKQ